MTPTEHDLAVILDRKIELNPHSSISLLKIH